MEIRGMIYHRKFKVAIIFITCLFLIFIFKAYWISRNIIYPHIKVYGVEIGNLTREQAKVKLAENIGKIIGEKSLVFSYQEEKWKIPYRDFNIQYDIEKTVDQAYYLGRDGNLLDKIRTYFQFRNQEKKLPLEISMDSNKIQKIIDQLEEKVNIKAEDAQIELKDQQIKILSEKTGRMLEEKKLEEIIREYLQFSKEQTIELPVKEVVPKITQEILNTINEKIASFSTNFNPQAKERVENLRIASDMTDGKILLPGEIFSVNKTIGPITKANGYKDAPVIVNGRLQSDVGGGVCQVSTTLYNAVVRANLEIVERQHHSMPVSYVPLGQDAAIAGDWKDFKFKNNSDYPIYIEMYIENNQIIANLYSNKELKQEISLETEIILTISPKTIYQRDSSKDITYKKVEREGKSGYQVHVYKVLYKNGKVIQRELLHKDYYQPVDKLMVVGTKGETIERILE